MWRPSRVHFLAKLLLSQMLTTVSSRYPPTETILNAATAQYLQAMATEEFKLAEQKHTHPLLRTLVELFGAHCLLAPFLQRLLWACVPRIRQTGYCLLEELLTLREFFG